MDQVRLRSKSMKNQIDPKLLEEIKNALAKIDGYGSVELYIQQNKITQITARNIRKTSNPIQIRT